MLLLTLIVLFADLFVLLLNFLGSILQLYLQNTYLVLLVLIEEVCFFFAH